MMKVRLLPSKPSPLVFFGLLSILSSKPLKTIKFVLELVRREGVRNVGQPLVCIEIAVLFGATLNHHFIRELCIRLDLRPNLSRLSFNGS